MSWTSRIEQTRQSGRTVPEPEGDFPVTEGVRTDRNYELLKDAVHKNVIAEYNNRYNGTEEPDNLKAEIRKLIYQMLASNEQKLTRVEEARLAQEILDDVVGLGPLEPLLRDETISEVMVNSPTQVFVERKGRLELTQSSFRDDAHVLQVINRIVSAVGRRCDESTPLVDARLADGSRFNAVIPPIALKGPSMTIRKFSSSPLQMKDLIGFGSMSIPMANFLQAAVEGRCNMIVAGGTGSGKTTLLNVLSSFISDRERIVTIEDAAELQLGQIHVVTLEARPSNMEGKGAITIRDLVKNALRMRPDRIVVGECRSGETLDMLQAMNTGHEGSLTTLHANTPRDVIARLETLVMMSGVELPAKAIREQIASAIDVIVHQTRLRDGSRKVVNISEVIGMEGETVVLQDIFTYKITGTDPGGRVAGHFTATGVHPKVLQKIKDNGALCKDEWFVPSGR